VRIHGCGDGEVARRPIEFDRHHAQLGAGKCCDLVDGGAAGGEIRHHLFGHRLRVGGDAAVRHAMIAGKDRDGDALQPRQLAGLPAREPDSQLFGRPRLPGGFVRFCCRRRQPPPPLVTWQSRQKARMPRCRTA
jgi:hypothetical protein